MSLLNHIRDSLEIFCPHDLDLSDLSNPNTFTFTQGFTAPFNNPVIGMQFDGSYADLEIKDQTLGATVFDGFMERPVGSAYYVRFEDGALLGAGGSPIPINGVFANYDGIIPADFLNLLLPPAILQDIEDRLFDTDDATLNGRGQIFAGLPDLPGFDSFSIENFEDFMGDFGFGLFMGGPEGLRITLTGMPSLGNFGSRSFNFNDIAPAAGDELDDIEPAAGGNSSDTDNADASGASCWSNAIEIAETGTPVELDYGGPSPEKRLRQLIAKHADASL